MRALWRSCVLGLWWSCVLGLLCSSVRQALGDAVTATQTPSSTSEQRLNSSITVTCSISGGHARGLSFSRRFDSQDVLFLSLRRGGIAEETVKREYEGRLGFRVEKSEEGLSVGITVSQLQVDDTDLYLCVWTCFKDHLETYSSTGSIVIVREYVPESLQPQCDGGDEDKVLDVVLVALSASSVPFVLSLLVLSVFAFCKRFKKNFTPSGPGVRPPPPPRRPLPACPAPPPQSQTYSYLSSSVSSAFSHEYVH